MFIIYLNHYTFASDFRKRKKSYKYKICCILLCKLIKEKHQYMLYLKK